MPFKAPKPQGPDFEPIPHGLHKAVTVGIFIIGTVWPPGWEKASKRIMFKWELPELEPLEVAKDGTPELLPRTISREFTFSMWKTSQLRSAIEGWTGVPFDTEAEAEDFDVSRLISSECMIQVIHNSKDGKVYANVKSIMPLPSGNPIQYATQSEPVLFDVDEHIGPDGSFLVEIPEWIQKRVMISEEYKAKTKLPSNRELGHQPAQRQPAPQQRQAPAPAQTQAARPVARPQAAAPRPPQQLHRGRPMQQPARRQPQPPPPDPEDDGRLPEPPDDVPMD